jgi:hypothetical protein
VARIWPVPLGSGASSSARSYRNYDGPFSRQRRSRYSKTPPYRQASSDIKEKGDDQFIECIAKADLPEKASKK